MPKLPTLKSKELIKILERVGFFVVRQSGSHILMENKNGHKAIIPYHNKDLKKGTLRAIIREAGLMVKDIVK